MSIDVVNDLSWEYYNSTLAKRGNKFYLRSESLGVIGVGTSLEDAYLDLKNHMQQVLLRMKEMGIEPPLSKKTKKHSTFGISLGKLPSFLSKVFFIAFFLLCLYFFASTVIKTTSNSLGVAVHKYTKKQKLKLKKLEEDIFWLMDPNYDLPIERQEKVKQKLRSFGSLVQNTQKYISE